MRFLLPLLLLLLLAFPAYAAEVRFNGHTFTPSAITAPSGAKSAPNSATPTAIWVCRLSSPSALSAGWIPLRYLGNGGYLVRATAPSTAASSLKAHPGVDLAWPLLPDMKIDAAFALDTVADSAPSPPDTLVIHLFDGTGLPAVRRLAAQYGATVTETTVTPRFARAGLRVDPSNHAPLRRALATLDGVFFLERDRGAQLFSNTAVPIIQSGSPTRPAGLFARGIYGTGQIVAICDTGIDADSCYFRDADTTLPPANIGFLATLTDPSRRKVIAANFLYIPDNPANPSDWDDQNHGTNVAGCVGGSRLADPFVNNFNNGMAPGAQIVMQDAGYMVDDCGDIPALGCPMIDITPVFQQAWNQGARIHNNSWGDRENFFPHNTYTARCEDVDAFTWTHKDFLVVCAGGNDGDVPGAVASPGVAKNALSVGGTGNDIHADEIIPFSSRGFASDGRIKPDVVAPATARMAGNDKNVDTWNCSVQSSQGTSFSSPFIAGACALVREYLARGFYPTGAETPADALPTPSAALVKALLINSATHVTFAAPIPARDQGWGRPVLEEALYFEGDARRLYLDDNSAGFRSADDAPAELAFHVNSDGGPLKVTLVWSDYPATPGADPQLVNDLDLRVTHNGVPYAGNHFANGASVPSASPDRLNNVEQVYLPNPPPGFATVRITPARIIEAPQDYALVVTGGIEPVESPPQALWRLH